MVQVHRFGEGATAEQRRHIRFVPPKSPKPHLVGAQTLQRLQSLPADEVVVPPRHLQHPTPHTHLQDCRCGSRLPLRRFSVDQGGGAATQPRVPSVGQTPRLPDQRTHHPGGTTTHRSGVGGARLPGCRVAPALHLHRPGGGFLHVRVGGGPTHPPDYRPPPLPLREVVECAREGSQTTKPTEGGTSPPRHAVLGWVEHSRHHGRRGSHVPQGWLTQHRQRVRGDVVVVRAGR